MSTTPTPLMSGSPGAEPVTNPAQLRQPGGFFSKIGAVLKTIAPYLEPIGARLAAAGGNYGPMELARQQREDALRQQLTQSQLQNQDLTRQLTQKQIDNYQTPAQAAQANLDYQRQLEIQRNQLNPPKDIVAPMDGGGMGHYSQSTDYSDPQHPRLVTTPTMVTKQVPNPTQQMVQPPAPPVGPQAPPMPAMPPPVGNAYLLRPPATVPQEVLGNGEVEPDQNSPTGFSRVYRGANLQEMGRTPAPAPYAYVGSETSNTQTQTGPNGVNQINQTTSRRTPIGGGAPPPGPMPSTKPNANAANGNSPNTGNMNFKVSGPEAKQMMDQDVALNATAQLIAKVRSQSQLFASMLDAGKIQLGADPNSGFFGNIISRNLSPQEAQLAGNVQSLMEHINTMRTALQAQGFRGEEAWNALQAQRGNLLQHPDQIDTTLGNTLQVVNGLLANHQKLLNRPGATNGATPSPKAAPRNADEYLRSIQQ
jgi:hypothetical protein